MAEPAAGPDTKGAAKVAALPADETGDAKANGPIRIEFRGDSSRLPEESWDELRVFARQLLRSNSLRAQVKAFAGDPSASESSARRLSLSRALAVRAFLMERGVRSTQIDVRAMGKQSEGGPSERVDVVLVDR
jgi:outer membrane protein OmpA-like peptidoglycan-associated protein